MLSHIDRSNSYFCQVRVIQTHLHLEVEALQTTTGKKNLANGRPACLMIWTNAVDLICAIKQTTTTCLTKLPENYPINGVTFPFRLFNFALALHTDNSKECFDMTKEQREFLRREREGLRDGGAEQLRPRPGMSAPTVLMW